MNGTQNYLSSTITLIYPDNPCVQITILDTRATNVITNLCISSLYSEKCNDTKLKLEDGQSVHFALEHIVVTTWRVQLRS